MDFHLAPLVFDTLHLTLSTDEALLLLESLDLIYDLRHPVKTETHA